MIRPLIPDPDKYKVILEYAQRYGLKAFIESGTASGDTTARMVPYMDRLYTIEIHYDSYLQATMRFALEPKVTTIFGESEIVLERLLRELDGPFLFWLDGHDNGLGVGSAGPCPVMEELKHIMYTGDHRPAKHCILIDDARSFGRDRGYPPLKRIGEFVGTGTWPIMYDTEVRDDIIRCTPR